MQQATPADVQRVQEMLDDLNALLAAHAAGQDTTEQFAEFMNKHGDYFPENPQTVDELVDLLAARSAAAQRHDAVAQPGAAGRAGRTEPAGVRRSHGSGSRSASWIRICRTCGRARTGPVPDGSAVIRRWDWARPPGPWRNSAGSSN